MYIYIIHYVRKVLMLTFERNCIFMAIMICNIACRIEYIHVYLRSYNRTVANQLSIFIPKLRLQAGTFFSKIFTLNNQELH